MVGDTPERAKGYGESLKGAFGKEEEEAPGGRGHGRHWNLKHRGRSQPSAQGEGTRAGAASGQGWEGAQKTTRGEGGGAGAQAGRKDKQGGTR